MMTVCVVSERSRETGRSYIFGVYSSEMLARIDYGRPDRRHEVRFDVIKVHHAAQD